MRSAASSGSRAGGRTITVVMYHFVRELEKSAFPEIKGLTVEQFRGQTEYLCRHFDPVGVEDVITAMEDPSARLPSRALLLTFDDGYRDHLENVLPILLEHGLRGCFFPPAKAITEHEVLDVNKIHFVLAAVPDKTLIVDTIFDLVDAERGDFSLRSRDEYRRDLEHPGRYDSAQVILIKRLLQRDLPRDLRSRITARLFSLYVTDDERSFARELYMSLADLRTLGQEGMQIGSHGYDHFWLDSLDDETQRREIELSLSFLETVGADVDRWVMGYPYGAYDQRLLRLLRHSGCRAGFTTEVRLASLDDDDPLTLPRIDTNDLPRRADAEPNEWTPPDQEG